MSDICIYFDVFYLLLFIFYLLLLLFMYYIFFQEMDFPTSLEEVRKLIISADEFKKELFKKEQMLKEEKKQK